MRYNDRVGPKQQLADIHYSPAYGGYWHILWIYFIAPTVGMLAAAETFLRIRRGIAPYCAKLHHANSERCIFHHTPQLPKRFTQVARGQESDPVQPPPARMVEGPQRSTGGVSASGVATANNPIAPLNAIYFQNYYAPARRAGGA